MTRGGKREGAGRKPGPGRKGRSIDLPVSLWAALSKAADELETTVNATVRSAVELWLAWHEHEKRDDAARARVGTKVGLRSKGKG